MKVNIANSRIETNEVNLITIDGTILPARGIFYDGHIIICKQNGRKIRCYRDYGLNFSQLEKILSNISSDMNRKGLENFTLLAGCYLINMDNMQEIHFKSNMLGIHLVEAEFQDGQIVELYKGCDEEYAITLIQNYERIEERYLNQCKAE